jgi:hypothetical protein
VRELLPFALLACACGAAVREPGPPTPPAPVAVAASPESSADASDDRAAFETLGALGPSVAPGMREAARKEGAGEPVELVKADTRDLCARVAFQATAPVPVKLVDEAGRVLAETAGPRDRGTLGEAGPVCVRKGEVVKGIAPAGTARVRWVAWAAP